MSSKWLDRSSILFTIHCAVATLFQQLDMNINEAIFFQQLLPQYQVTQQNYANCILILLKTCSICSSIQYIHDRIGLAEVVEKEMMVKVLQKVMLHDQNSGES